MTKAVKFSFQTLQQPAPGAPALRDPASIKRVLTDRQLAEIKAAAYAEGAHQGELTALTRIEQAYLAAVDAIASQHSALLAHISGQMAGLRAQSTALAMEVAKCFAPALMARQPYAEIEGLFNDCVASLISEPRIVIRVQESLVAELKIRIEAAAQKASYQGRVVILGDADSTGAQCQIEWADGGVVANASALLAEIEERIAGYLDGSRPAQI